METSLTFAHPAPPQKFTSLGPVPPTRGIFLSGSPRKHWTTDALRDRVRTALAHDNFPEARRLAAEARLAGWKLFVHNMDLIGLCVGDGIVTRMQGNTSSIDFVYETLKNGIRSAVEEIPSGITPACVSWLHLKGVVIACRRCRPPDIRYHLAQIDPHTLSRSRLAYYYVCCACEKTWHFPNTMDRFDEAMWDLDAAEELGFKRGSPMIANVEKWIYRELYGTTRPKSWMILGMNTPPKSTREVSVVFHCEIKKCHPDKIRRLGAAHRSQRLINAKDTLNAGFPAVEEDEVMTEPVEGVVVPGV